MPKKLYAGRNNTGHSVRHQPDEARCVHTLPKHPPPARTEVVWFERRKAVVVAGENVHRVDDDEAQESAGFQFRRVRADVQRALQLLPDGPGVDEKEGPALVPHKLRRFVEKTLEPQSLASLCEVGKQSVITALPFALELNPRASHVVGHRLDTGPGSIRSGQGSGGRRIP